MQVFLLHKYFLNDLGESFNTMNSSQEQKIVELRERLKVQINLVETLRAAQSESTEKVEALEKERSMMRRLNVIHP
jgi:hypothetical protein